MRPKVWKSVWYLLKPHWARVVLTSLLALFASLAEGMGLTLFGPVLELATGQERGGYVYLREMIKKVALWIPGGNRVSAILATILILTVLKNILSYASAIVATSVETDVTHHLRTRLFDSLLNVNHSFWITTERGQIVETLSSEVSKTALAVDWFLFLIIQACAASVFVMLLLLISPRLYIRVVAGILVISGLIHCLMPRVRRYGEAQVKASATLGQRLLDTIAGIRTVNAFCLESLKRTLFHRESYEAGRTAFKVRAVAGVTHRISEILYALLLISVLVVALQDRATLPFTGVFLFILFRLQPYANDLNKGRAELSALAGAVGNVVTALSQTSKDSVSCGAIKFSRLRSEILFDRVSVSHTPGDVPTLRNISFRIPSGKVTAVVGPTGSGKTTLINLLCRFKDPTEGAIYVDGTQLSNFDLSSWRGAIALAGQDMHLFSTTIRQNIQYGRIDATDDEVLLAAQEAYAHDFILAMPQGYDTRVGEQGARLSGGERQRIALARAFVRNPEILVLDEATSALDSISEALVQKAIDKLCSGRTVIIIAHRLSSIRRADQVIVLGGGGIIEQGSPKDLLRDGGLFAELYDKQIATNCIDDSDRRRGERARDSHCV